MDECQHFFQLVIDDKHDNRITSDNGIDSEVIDLANQLSADACSHSLISTSSSVTPTTGITTTTTRHSAIRTVATNHYPAIANKKMKLHQDGLKLMGDNFNLNDCVDIEMHSIDRTNTDPKYLLPCLIVEKFQRNNIFITKLSPQTSIQTWSPGFKTGNDVITHTYHEEVFILGGSITDLSLEQTFGKGSHA